jgi:hypothetical protein
LLPELAAGPHRRHTPSAAAGFLVARQPDLVHIGKLVFTSGKAMRFLFLGLALVSATVVAQQLPANFNQKEFEKRFRAADKDGNGMLSREEAYAEFPRAPEFFDEMDTNYDRQVTLTEVNQAMERRLQAAMNASSTGSKYVKPQYLGDQPKAAVDDPEMENLFSSQEEARRHEFYESLAGDQDNARKRGIPPPIKTSPNLLNKSF